MTIVTDKGVEVRYITVDHLPNKVYVTAYHEYAEGYRITEHDWRGTGSKVYTNKQDAEKQAKIMTEKEHEYDSDPATHWGVVELDFV